MNASLNISVKNRRISKGLRGLKIYMCYVKRKSLTQTFSRFHRFLFHS